MLSPHLTGWKAQYDRMKRAYARLLEPHRSSIDYDDDLQHFFQDCWHLKDWIKNDESLTLNGNIEDIVKGYKPLEIAADLANASKHLVRKQRDRTGARVTSKSVTVYLGQSRGADTVHVVTLADDSTHRATDVARDACDAWDTILRQQGLL